MITQDAYDGGGEAMPADGEESESGKTAVLPLSMIGAQQVAPGDSISLKVVSVDDEGITVEYAHAPESEEPPEDGLDYMARTGERHPPSMNSES